MPNFVMCLADIPIQVNCLFDSTEIYCKDFVCDIDPVYDISISERDILFERNMDALDVSDQYLETLAVFRKIAELLIDDDIILFHSSVIELDGYAYVFGAPSGTGKSTHTGLWREYFKGRDVHMINDDKPLMKIDDQIEIYGTPWMGKERLGENRSAPVKAICFLKQGKKNMIRRLDYNDALTKVFRQTYRSSNRDKLEKTMKLLDELCQRIPVYEMDCTISEDAVKLAYAYMKGETEDETEG